MVYIIWVALLWTVLLVITLKAVGIPRRAWYVLAAFALAGFIFAFVGDLASSESRATALGFFHTIVGIGLLPGLFERCG
jgi:hypothetical protein